jgi:hypothetical protein
MRPATASLAKSMKRSGRSRSWALLRRSRPPGIAREWGAGPLQGAAWRELTPLVGRDEGLAIVPYVPGISGKIVLTTIGVALPSVI